MVQDITAQKLTEAAQRAAQRHLDIALEAAMGTWQIDVATNQRSIL